VTFPLDSVRVKMARADRHVRDLKIEVDTLVRAAEQTIFRENDEDSTKLVYRIGHVPDIDPTISAIIGDAVSNIRAAFDHLAWQLVLADNGVPCEHTQFPIYDSRLNDKGNPRNVTIQPRILNSDILQALDLIQPYQTTDTDGHVDAWRNQLWIVRQLSNIDKHRLLIAVVVDVNFDDRPPYWGSSSAGVPVSNFYPFRALKSGDKIAAFDFRGTRAPADFDPHMSLGVTLDEGPEAHEIRLQGVPALLHGLRHILTGRINQHFMAFFPTDPGIPWPDPL
jgi:hypothetical protein